MGWLVGFVFKGTMLVTFSFSHKSSCLSSLLTDAVSVVAHRLFARKGGAVNRTVILLDAVSLTPPLFWMCNDFHFLA